MPRRRSQLRERHVTLVPQPAQPRPYRRQDLVDPIRIAHAPRPNHELPVSATSRASASPSANPRLTLFGAENVASSPATVTATRDARSASPAGARPGENAPHRVAVNRSPQAEPRGARADQTPRASRAST
jgi:hypothetical protein